MGLRTRLEGPRRSLILALGLFNIWIGIGTLEGHAGTPEGAPHLLIPEGIRGAVWLITGAVGIGVSLLSSRFAHHRLALTMLTIMPSVRFVSYTWSWALSWAWLNGLPDSMRITIALTPLLLVLVVLCARAAKGPGRLIVAGAGGVSLAVLAWWLPMWPALSHLPSAVTDGSPKGGYGAVSWAMQLALCWCVTWAPARWESLEMTLSAEAVKARVSRHHSR